MEHNIKILNNFLKTSKEKKNYFYFKIHAVDSKRKNPKKKKNYKIEKYITVVVDIIGTHKEVKKKNSAFLKIKEKKFKSILWEVKKPLRKYWTSGRYNRNSRVEQDRKKNAKIKFNIFKDLRIKIKIYAVGSKNKTP